MSRGRPKDGDRPPPRFLQVSTDEVYGTKPRGRSREVDPVRPRSPYAAAKAAGELLAISYSVTYGLDVVVTRGSNTYGPHQHVEKLIPLFVTNAMDDQQLPLYGDGLQRRDWLFVSDHAGAVEFVLRHGKPGEIYNIPGEAELPNREVVAELLRQLGKPWSLVRRVEDRPGHDRRYAMDGTKLRALGWRNRVGFVEGLAATVDWYRANEAWWRRSRRASGMPTTRGSTRPASPAAWPWRRPLGRTSARPADARRGHRRRRPVGAGSSCSAQ